MPKHQSLLSGIVLSHDPPGLLLRVCLSSTCCRDSLAPKEKKLPAGSFVVLLPCGTA